MNEVSTIKRITLNRYDGKELIVSQISDLIVNEYSFLFYAVIIHGSIATDEVIPYSDFDGLLIVKDNYVDSEELKQFERKSLKLIFEFDPLQHHRWFQILESDLINYPEDYFPCAILEHSKLIYPQQDELTLDLKIKSTVNYNNALIGLIDKLEKQLSSNWRPSNSYQLKSFLSEIMLIPSLYYSLKNNSGIFKKDSFNAVKDNFNENEWMPIKVASKIRTNWNYPLNPIQKRFLSITNWRIRKKAIRLYAPKINESIKQELSSEFYVNLMLFIKRIRKDI
ncbi:nucleotidyltransferase family protein [Winogradskyella tangerina]|uniref:hypothetical protein n=1 Tax=Winogradskyella tangerina TaxID=2023240 RepID=UPI000DBE6783|nr:hypothetical protein [Winogradskyella tangerina]